VATSNKVASLQDLIDSVPNLVEYFYNDTLAPHSRERAGLSPVPAEFSNWREEQHAWRKTAVLFDQSHHMPEMFLEGPDAFRLLNHIGINSFANFVPGMAKQFVACSPSGYVIGDCILFYLGHDSFELVSGMTLQDWVQFQAEKGGYKVFIKRDPPTSLNPTGRTNFRFGLDGPCAEKIFAEIVEGEVPEIPFFRTARVKIAGCDVLALRHGMAGHKGVELAGPYEKGPAVRSAILAAGNKYGILPAGKTAYFSTVAESGWMAYPLPAIYTGEEMTDFREWLPATSWEAHSQLAGSYYSKNIEDYYNTLWDLGYGRLLKFDHDFIGRPALERMAKEAQRINVTLVWHREDVTRIFDSLLGDGPRYKYINLPAASYGFPQCDEVRSTDGKLIGFSNLSGYSGNESKMLSLAMVDKEHSVPGTEVILMWGEPNGGSRKPHVERHEQLKVRAIVAPLPYAQSVRLMKRATLGGA
jgi:glycine cleavage system aminomethyltransferase T